MSLHPTRREVELWIADGEPFPYDPIPEIADEYEGGVATAIAEGETPKWITYAEYLLTAEWLEYRAAIFDRQGGKCAMCPGKATHCHHRTYNNVGWEADDDCTGVCARCHARHHGKKPRR